MMVYDKEFSNFELQCDYKVTVLCNSGIFVRTFPLTPDGSVGFNGIEIAIQDGIKVGYHERGDLRSVTRPRRRHEAHRPVESHRHHLR